MGYILVQHSHDVQFTQLLDTLRGQFEIVEATDAELVEVVERYQQQISGFVISHLTEPALRVADLLTDERFNAPTTSIAFVGKISMDLQLPYAAISFDLSSGTDLVSYLSEPRRISVLVVEDDEAIRDVLTLSLTTHFHVESVADGTQAMHALQNAQYDVVVLDVMLPGVSGEEVFSFIRDSLPKLPVIIITAFDTKERELEFTFRGADAYIPKPFDSNLSFRRRLMDTLKSRHFKSASHTGIGQREAATIAWQDYEYRMRTYT